MIEWILFGIILTCIVQVVYRFSIYLYTLFCPNGFCVEQQEPMIYQDDSNQNEEPVAIYHFRLAVTAVLALANHNPESVVYRKRKSTLRIKRSSVSIRKLRLPKKTSKSSLKSKPITVDKSFCFSEHVHEWNISPVGKIKFTDHSPVAFQILRQHFNFSSQDLQKSLEKPFDLLPTQGKSDAIFFTSHDNRILFKTLRGSEPNNLKAFLQDYIRHLSVNPDSFLPKFLGLYTFERHSRMSASSMNIMTESLVLPSKFTVVAMANVFDGSPEIHYKFDFKGAQLGRESLKPDSIYENLSQVTLKELDYFRLYSDGLVKGLQVPVNVKSQLIQQLEKDLGLLQKRGFMDYSLLVGIYKHSRPPVQDIESVFEISRPESETFGSFFQLARQFLLDPIILQSPQEKQEKEPLLKKPSKSIIQMDETSMWLDLPFHKSFQGGLRSIPLEGEYDYEIYYIGIIDILQRYNITKWLEKEIKQKTSFFSDNPLAHIFSQSQMHLPSGSDKKYPTPSTSPHSPKMPSPILSSPTMSSSNVRDSIYSCGSNSDFRRSLGEPSVEEPGRYGQRLIEFLESIW